ncbi:MAG TPA: hypothetical protein VHB77_22020 [Planctomycetaceae bacterium]|nr:hypothetical protein [Planctomycetaceae bacterium]
MCRWPIPRNTIWEGKPVHTARHIPANWAGGIASTGENMSLAIAGVTNVDVYTRQNHTWHTGTVLAHMFSLARELQQIHHGLHHVRVGQLDQLQQAKQAATKPAAPDSAPAANPVPQPIDLPNANAAPAADAGPGAMLDVRV